MQKINETLTEMGVNPPTDPGPRVRRRTRFVKVAGESKAARRMRRREHRGFELVED